MTINTASKQTYKFLLALGMVTALASCGGGGSKKDSTPDSFSITPISNAAVATEVTSAPVTVTGFNQSVPVSISGGTYSIGGGAYTSSAGTVTNGQVVTVKVTTSDKTNTAVTATLTVGGVSGQFTATTIPDVTPTAFSFTAATNVGAKSVNTSNEITVAGIDVAVPISITSGEYSINGAAYTSAASTVSKDQKVIVRATASDKPATKVTAALTIGGITGNYDVTTYADTVAPTAQILFPPPVSMTEANTILVRGSASDEFSAIKSVKVNGVTATTTDGFKNWQALVALTDTTKPVIATTLNTLTVATEDSIGNKSTNAGQVKITQADFSIAFPNAENNFEDISGVVLDKFEGRNRVLVNDYSKGIIAVDLDNGERTVFSGVNNLQPGLVIDAVAQRLYAIQKNSNTTFLSVDLKDGSKYQEYIKEYLGHSVPYGLTINHNAVPAKVVGVSLANGDIYSTTTAFLSLDPFSTSTVPDSNNIISRAWGIAFDKKNNRYLVADESQHKIFSVDATTGMRTVFSSNSVGTGEAFGEIHDSREAELTAIQIDEENLRAIVFESRIGKLFSVDLSTGNRSVLSAVTEANAENVVRHAYGLTIFSPESYALVTAERSPLHGLVAIDLVTGKRVILSKSAGASPY